ncbi:Pentatricopeptide repeat [Zostera marina]|uniref:Pentatricopeptide repeat n=1 Tax=Zostera marina TaxID=29655 RepID=A0A0K9PQF7_ZOSMR|nr:Pentatricopeptide repeat [Zostera marina]
MTIGGATKAIRWTNQITPAQVLHLIRTEPDTRKALLIFNSATDEYSNGYCHDHQTFSCIISRLASSNLFSDALHLLTSPLKLPLPFPEPAFLSLLHAYSRAHRPHQTLLLFRRMISEFQCRPTIKSYVTVLTALVDGDQMKLAHEFYKEMRDLRLDECLPVYNVMVKAFSKNQKTIDYAIKVFDAMPEKGVAPDCYTYGSLITGLCRAGRVEKALGLFNDMKIPASVFTYSTLIHGLCVSEKVDDAVKLFEEMPEKGVKPNVVTFSTVIDGLCKASRSDEAMKILEKMGKSKCCPNKITYSSLMNGLCKDRRTTQALEVIDRMRLHGHKPDAGIYSNLIQCLLDVGKIQEAANFLDEMTLGGVKPHRLTWSLHIRIHNVVAQALCKGDELNRAFQVYLSMKTRSITTLPMTFHQLVDGFCRKGDVHKAASIVHEMLDDGCVPEVITWDSVVSGFFNRRKAREAAELVLGSMN